MLLYLNSFTFVSLLSSGHQEAIGGESDANLQPDDDEPPILPVIQYIESHNNHLHVRLLAALHFTSATEEIYHVCTGWMHHTSVVGGVNRWGQA